jgi:hypothetical protein
MFSKPCTYRASSGDRYLLKDRFHPRAAVSAAVLFYSLQILKIFGKLSLKD